MLLLLAPALLAGIASAQSFRGATIVAKDPSTEPAMQEGVWYGPEALLPWDVVYNNDKRYSTEYDVEADGRIPAGRTWPACQWHVKFAYRFTPQGLIDPNAVYYAQILSGAQMNVAYKVKGRYPPTIYFSWQVYNSLFTGEAAQGTTDFKITPHWGKNPFTDGSATPDNTGGYELYLTPSGAEGYANELRLPRGVTNTLILRMYKADPSLNDTLRIDEIEPPVLYVGNTLNDGTREWRALPQCSERQKLVFDDAATNFYETNYLQTTGTLGRGVVLRDYNCPLNPHKGNVSMVLFEGAWLTPQVQNLVARQSSDSPYLFYCINPENNWSFYLNTVFTIRMKLPAIPNGLYEPIKVAALGEYDVRYLSISTADGILPQPVIQTVDGQGIKKHYSVRRGGLDNWDGYVNIRVALNEAKAKECGIWNDEAVFLPLVSERVHPSKAIILIYRSVLAHGPKSAGAASRACNKTVNCGNPGFVRNIMQEYYPEMEVFHCEEGKLTKYADYWAGAGGQHALI